MTKWRVRTRKRASSVRFPGWVQVISNRGGGRKDSWQAKLGPSWMRAGSRQRVLSVGDKRDRWLAQLAAWGACMLRGELTGCGSGRNYPQGEKKGLDIQHWSSRQVDQVRTRTETGARGGCVGKGSSWAGFQEQGMKDSTGKRQDKAGAGTGFGGEQCPESMRPGYAAWGHGYLSQSMGAVRGGAT